jgi:hypothetical protein
MRNIEDIIKELFLKHRKNFCNKENCGKSFEDFTEELIFTLRSEKKK